LEYFENDFLANLGSLLSVDSNIMSLPQREHHNILAEIGVGHGKSGYRRTNYVISSAKLYISTFTTASHGFPVTARLCCLNSQLNCWMWVGVCESERHCSWQRCVRSF